MQQLKILNKKEAKELLSKIKSQWGCDLRLDYVFLINSKNRIYVITKDMKNVGLSKLRIDSIGMYFGEDIKGELRLSIEGSQIIGPHAEKNVIELNEDESRDWLRGKDIETLRNSDCLLRAEARRVHNRNSWCAQEHATGFSPCVLDIINNSPAGSGGFAIIKHEDDFLGCGKHKEGNILNYVPKTRRVGI